MYFIITGLAAITATVIWYINSPADKYRLSTLCLIYWGATLMWLVDHVMAYLDEGGEFFEISLDASLLGISVVLLGLFIWIAANPNKILSKLFHAEN